MNISENPLQSSIDEYGDDDQALSLMLSVYYCGQIGCRTDTTPPKDGSIIKTAQVFYKYLTSEYH